MANVNYGGAWHNLRWGVTHIMRGNITGASRLLSRAADRLEPDVVDPPHRVPVNSLVAWARKLVRDVERDSSRQAPTRMPTLLLYAPEAVIETSG